MKQFLARLTALAAVWILMAGTGWAQPAAPKDQALSDEIMARSLVDMGDTARLQHVLAKARRGEPVVVSVIGGSITQGARASKPEFVYGNRIAQWWRETFPKADIKFVNAGIGATGSEIGAHRASKHLLPHEPDFVVVEYAVNDRNTPLFGKAYEGLIRQILNGPKQPAAVALFTMHSDGGNTQETHEPICRHYGVPMVSFRDALWPEVDAQRIAWDDIEADAVHPNDLGHSYCAQFVTRLLDTVLADLPADAELARVKPVPSPLRTDVFEHATFLNADDITPTRNEGWTVLRGDGPERSWGPGWQADTPGSVIEFEVDAEVVGVLFWRIKGGMGTAEAQVDDRASKKLNAYFDADWGGYTPYQLVSEDLAPGRHVLRITLLEDRDENSTGNAFQIRAIMLGRPRD